MNNLKNNDPVTRITKNDINALIKGSLLLGSGGGGDENTAFEVGEKMLQHILKNNELEVVPFDYDLLKDGLVFVTMAIGYSDARINLNNIDENKIQESISELLIRFKKSDKNKKLKYVIPYESGLFNLIFTLIAVAIYNYDEDFRSFLNLKDDDKLKIIDCDCSGRAIPKADLTPFYIKNKDKILPMQAVAYCKKDNSSTIFNHFNIKVDNNNMIIVTADHKINKSGNIFINPFSNNNQPIDTDAYFKEFDTNIKNQVKAILNINDADIPFGALCCCWVMETQAFSDNIFINNTISNIIKAGKIFLPQNNLITDVENIFKVNNVHQLVIKASIPENSKDNQFGKNPSISENSKNYFSIKIGLIDENEETYIIYFKNEILLVTKKKNNQEESKAMAPDIIFITRNDIPITLIDLLSSNNKKNISIYGFKSDEKIVQNKDVISKYIQEINSIYYPNRIDKYTSIDVLNKNN